MKDLVDLRIKGRQLVAAVYGNGFLRIWDLATQKRVFAEALLSDAHVDTITPRKIAAVSSLEDSSTAQSSSNSLAALNILVVFGPRDESSATDSDHQVNL